MGLEVLAAVQDEGIRSRDPFLKVRDALVMGRDEEGGILFGLAMDSYRDFFFRHASRFAGNTADASDLCQETWVRLWQNAAKYVPIGNPDGYVYSILLNASIEMRRRGQRRSLLATRLLECEAIVFPESETYLDDAIDQAAAKMDKLTRAIFYSRLYGLSFPEIRDLLGLSISIRAIRKRYERALAMVKSVVMGLPLVTRSARKAGRKSRVTSGKVGECLASA